jgi:hypothetical protein
MGNSTNKKSPIKEERRHHSFEKINMQNIKGLGLNTSINSDDRRNIKHRLSTTNLSVRNQYFNKILQNNKKENEERMSVMSKGSFRKSVSIFGKKLNSSDSEEFNNSIEYNDNPFDERSENHLNHSYDDRPMSLNMSMGSTLYGICGDRQSTSIDNRAAIVNLSKHSSRKNSDNSKNEKLSSRKDSLNTLSNKTKSNSNSLNNSPYNKKIRKSLNNNYRDQSSFSNTKNTLFLENELLNEQDLEKMDIDKNLLKNHSRGSNFVLSTPPKNIDIKNKRKTLFSHSSDDIIEISKNSLKDEFRQEFTEPEIIHNLSGDNINHPQHHSDMNLDQTQLNNNFRFVPNGNDNISVFTNLYSNSTYTANTSTLKNGISRNLDNTIISTYNDYELNFVKNGEDLRRSYIAKLIYKKIWQPSKKEKDHNTMIIFDWDDTLLCTSFLTPGGVFNEDVELTDKEKEKLAKLEFCALRILTLAIEKSDTYIITNAAPGWVEYSAERFYPSVKKILPKVKIISARGDYESIYPGDSRMWKIQAFLNMQKNFDNNLVTNIICLGDSFIEMEAGHVLASKFTQAFIKTVKFRESPKPEELNKQLMLVADQFPAIFSAVKNLTIRVEKKAKR